MERDRTLLLEEGLRASWFAPPQEPSESGDAYLVRCCSSFASHHELPGHLVLILQPTAIRDVAGYETWLLEIAELLPERLRIIVVDAARAPVWLRLSEQGRKRVTTREAALDTPGALAEISQNAGELDTPGGQFRETFLQLSAALGAQDLPRALRAGQQALAIAAEQGWFELSVPIHAVLGSALAADGKADDARLQFESAEQNALRGQSEGDPSSRDVCAKLRLQSRLGLGSALIAAEDYTEAARVFEDTVPIAAVAGDTSVQLECYRLAAFCYERADAPDTAFARARAGLELAKLLPRETLATTNFPLLAAAVLELCEGAGHSDLRAGLEREIAALDGESTPAAINPTDGPA